jgi:predicted phosphohydrolase
MRMVWTTDPHLNHVPLRTWEGWIATIRELGGDAILITGDISEGDDVVFELKRLAEALSLPIFFVLGNHDFYQSSIASTRREVIELCREHPQLIYLTDTQPIELSPGRFVVGDDGWGDATVGDYAGSPVKLHDFRLIDEFRSVLPNKHLGILRSEGRASAARLEQKLRAIPEDAEQVIVLTHVPPFRQACWYEGRTTDDWWAPFFVCGAVGNVLEKIASQRPSTRYTTLCGHTHHCGVAYMADNLIVYTGAAEYGAPHVHGILSLADQVCRVEILERI